MATSSGRREDLNRAIGAMEQRVGTLRGEKALLEEQMQNADGPEQARAKELLAVVNAHLDRDSRKLRDLKDELANTPTDTRDSTEREGERREEEKREGLMPIGRPPAEPRAGAPRKTTIAEKELNEQEKQAMKEYYSNQAGRKLEGEQSELERARIDRGSARAKPGGSEQAERELDTLRGHGVTKKERDALRDYPRQVRNLQRLGYTTEEANARAREDIRKRLLRSGEEPTRVNALMKDPDFGWEETESTKAADEHAAKRKIARGVREMKEAEERKAARAKPPPPSAPESAEPPTSQLSGESPTERRSESTIEPTDENKRKALQTLAKMIEVGYDVRQVEALADSLGLDKTDVAIQDIKRQREGAFQQRKAERVMAQRAFHQRRDMDVRLQKAKARWGKANENAKEMAETWEHGANIKRDEWKEANKWAKENRRKIYEEINKAAEDAATQKKMLKDNAAAIREQRNEVRAKKEMLANIDRGQTAKRERAKIELAKAKKDLDDMKAAHSQEKQKAMDRSVAHQRRKAELYKELGEAAEKLAETRAIRKKGMQKEAMAYDKRKEAREKASLARKTIWEQIDDAKMKRREHIRKRRLAAMKLIEVADTKWRKARNAEKHLKEKLRRLKKGKKKQPRQEMRTLQAANEATAKRKAAHKERRVYEKRLARSNTALKEETGRPKKKTHILFTTVSIIKKDGKITKTTRSHMTTFPDKLSERQAKDAAEDAAKRETKDGESVKRAKNAQQAAKLAEEYEDMLGKSKDESGKYVIVVMIEKRVRR